MTVFMTAGCAASGGGGYPPPLNDRYSRVLSARMGDQAPLAQCRVGDFDLGPTESAGIRRFPIELALPTGFVWGPVDLPVRPVWHPLLQRRWPAQEWLPGLHIEPEYHYRWTRAHRAQVPGVVLPATLFQLEVGSAYPVIQILPPWSFTETEECVLEFPGGTARVLRFTLRHTTGADHWGVMASWRVRGPEKMGLLALGPDPAVQAEALTILRGVHR